MRTHFNESDLVWSAKLDGVYWTKVYRLAPYKGVLVVTLGDKEIGRKDVGLMYDAQFGPDVADVEFFMDEGVKIVDGQPKS